MNLPNKVLGYPCVQALGLKDRLLLRDYPAAGCNCPGCEAVRKEEEEGAIE